MLVVRLVPILLVLSALLRSGCGSNVTDVEIINYGIGYELMEQRLDTLELKFMNLFVYVKELGETLLKNQRHILEQEVACRGNPNQNFSISAVETSTPLITEKCSEAKAKISELLELQELPNRNGLKFYELDGECWLVFQQRFNGSVNFYRNWAEYRNGFGVVGEEFWLGLEILHKLTSQRSYELLVELKDTTGSTKYARYSEFAIGSEKERYLISKLGSHSGTAQDKLSYHSGAKFSTFDSDNDSYRKSCAQENRGAWWFKACYESHLNGAFNATSWGNSLPPMSTRMMIREIQ